MGTSGRMGVLRPGDDEFAEPSMGGDRPPQHDEERGQGHGDAQRGHWANQASRHSHQEVRMALPRSDSLRGGTAMAEWRSSVEAAFTM